MQVYFNNNQQKEWLLPNLFLRSVSISTKTITPLALKRARGVIVLVLSKQSDRKGNNKVSKCKLKKYLFGNKPKERGRNFATL